MPMPFEGFTREQKRNVMIYAAGIMCYKFALEWFNGAFITLANERFGDKRYEKIGILTGLNSAMQCVGSILIAPLIKKFATRTVLSCAVFTFGLISAVLMICDGATGGKIRFLTADNKTHYGTWNPNGLFPIYIISGISYGMVELIRRVIPRDLVGGDVQKLRRTDAMVHVLYEVAGTAGAFTSPSLIGKFGYNFSPIFSPILFTLAACIWRCVSNVPRVEDLNRTEAQLEQMEREDKEKSQGYFAAILSGAKGFGKATYYGAYLVMTNRKYCWLFVGYSMALYGHRYLENGLAPIFAKQVLGVSSWSQIMVGGSNFGELLGALSVLFFTNIVQTPIPWLRIDAIALNIVWVLPFISVAKGQVSSAWKMAAIFLPVSYGWAAGDVSLAAYIQSSLAKLENVDPDVSALGAVMAFLYVSYIVTYAVLSAVLGKWADRQLAKKVSPRTILKYLGGVQFTILCILVLLATLIPRGAIAFNPKLIEGNNSVEDDETDSQEAEEQVNGLKKRKTTGSGDVDEEYSKDYPTVANGAEFQREKPLL